MLQTLSLIGRLLEPRDQSHLCHFPAVLHKELPLLVVESGPVTESVTLRKNRDLLDKPDYSCLNYCRKPFLCRMVINRFAIKNGYNKKHISKLPTKGLIIARRVHPEKKGIRVLGIAESFKKSAKKSLLAGVVMRRDLIIDGMAFGTATIEGDDATNSIVSMHRLLARDDINCILLDGLVISMYNIIDGEQVAGETGLPVIAITFEDSKGLEDSIKRHFNDGQDKLVQYQKLGRRERVALKTGKNLFIRCWRVNPRRALAILNSFTIQGSIPEPIRVAKLAARSYANALNYELEKN